MLSHIPLPNRSHIAQTSGHSYSYIYYPTTSSFKPTVLLLHGFPSASHDWRFQIAHLKFLGYGVLAPNLLGYGNSSKPSDLAAYVGTVMSRDMIEILDHEGVKGKIVVVAHDWGTYILSQLIVWFPERLEKVVFLCVPFTPPGRKADIEALNKLTKKRLGYELYGYWMFLTRDGAGKVIGEHVSL